MKINFSTLLASGNETALRGVFAWLTRIGAAPKFGTRPIGWYQAHQRHAIEVLKAYCGAGEHTLRCKGGVVETYSPLPGNRRAWFVVTPVSALYSEADKRSRG